AKGRHRRGGDSGGVSGRATFRPGARARRIHGRTVMSARTKLVTVAGAGLAMTWGMALVASPARAQDGATQVQGPGAAEQAAAAPMFDSAEELLDALETA